MAYSYTALQSYTCYFSYVALSPASLTAKMNKLEILKLFRILHTKSYENVEGLQGNPGPVGQFWTQIPCNLGWPGAVLDKCQVYDS